MLIRNPRTSPILMALAVIAALGVAAFIVHIVFTFAWYASGLAADKQERLEKEKRRDEPIDVQFSDPNGG